MYFNTQDQLGFLRSEAAGLRAARDAATAIAARAHAQWLRTEETAEHYRDDPVFEDALWSVADGEAVAAREQFRRSHREAVALRDEVVALDCALDDDGCDDDDYDDEDEDFVDAI